MGRLTVAGRSRRKKQHRIFFTHRIGLFDFTEQLRRIPELRLELGTDFFTHFIAAAVNARTDRGLEITSPAPEVPSQLTHALLDDAFHRAPPTRMKYPDRTALRVDKNDGQAIGGLNAEQ